MTVRPRAGWRTSVTIGTTTLCLALAIPDPSAAQLDWSGYYEHQLAPQEIAGDLVIQDYDRLRLDLFAAVDERITFAGDLVWRLSHGASELNALDFIPRRVIDEHAAATGTTGQDLLPLFVLPIGDEHYVDNACASLYLGRLSLRLGKQQLAWGTGYTWNPTDVFHDKSALDPTYEKEGVSALRAEVGFGLEGQLVTLLSVGEDWEHTTRAVKGRNHWGAFDVSSSLVELREEAVDYATGAPRHPRRRLVGADFSGELAGLGIWGEGAHNWMQSADDFGQYLLGLDHTFLDGTYVIGEYYRNGRGRGDEAGYTFDDWMRLLGARGESLGRDYLFVGASRPARELWTLSAYGIANLSDHSAVLFPWIEYSLGDNAELDLAAYLPVGSGGTEYAELGAGGLARIRVYF